MGDHSQGPDHGASCRCFFGLVLGIAAIAAWQEGAIEWKDASTPWVPGKCTAKGPLELAAMISRSRPRWYRVDLPLEVRKMDGSLITVTTLHGETHEGGTESLDDQVALMERILGHSVPHELETNWRGHLIDEKGYGKCKGSWDHPSCTIVHRFDEIVGSSVPCSYDPRKLKDEGSPWGPGTIRLDAIGPSSEGAAVLWILLGVGLFFAAIVQCCRPSVVMV